MTKNLIFKLYYFIIPVLILGISLGFGSFQLALFALLPLLFITTRHTVAIFLVMYGGPLCGVIRAMYPSVPIYGLVMELLGFLMMWDLIVDLFKNNSKAIGVILLTLSFFGFFYLLGPETEFARNKYFTMCTHGVFMVFGYYAFERSTKVDAEGLTRLLLVAGICMFMYAIQIVNMRAGSLFDYNWFREQFKWFAKANDWEGTAINYQHIGMMISFAMAVCLSQRKLELPVALFYIICALQLVLTSGARQAIMGVLLIKALRFSVFKESNLRNTNQFGRFVWTAAGLLIAYFVIFAFLESINSEAMSLALGGESGRDEHYIEAMAIFLQNPLAGCGIGGYQAITQHSWPHNFFLELLCETGLIGLIGSFILIIVPLIQKRQGLLHLSASNQFYFLIIMALFVRVMVSSDLRESIELFSAVYAITATKRIVRPTGQYPKMNRILYR